MNQYGDDFATARNSCILNTVINFRELTGWKFMFTGIIQGLGTIITIKYSGRGVVFSIKPDFILEEPQVGESIAVSGVCLTATSISSDSFNADVSPETLSRSTLGRLQPGDKVNLERALRLSDRLGGHIVSGHVDGVGRIVEKRVLSQFNLYTISVPKGLDRYIIEKGSVTVDGISLTVNSCGSSRFQVAVIPHTAKITTMGLRNIGDNVNIEVDVIGKYIEKLLVSDKSGEQPRSGIDQALLARYGFL